MNNNELKILIDSEKLQKRIIEVADEINSTYPHDITLNLICVLKGAVMFFAELAKYLKMPTKMEFIQLSSYGSSKASSGVVKSINLNLPEYNNEDVLIVEDILDTGLTLDFLMKYIKEKLNPKSLKLAVLFDKKCSRKFEIEPDFCAFEVDNKFIVGFGLDFDEKYRNLNYIGYFE